jgi:hypothetical protein
MRAAFTKAHQIQTIPVKITPQNLSLLFESPGSNDNHAELEDEDDSVGVGQPFPVVEKNVTKLLEQGI